MTDPVASDPPKVPSFDELYIGGEWRKGSTARPLPVVYPHNGEVIGHATEAGVAEAEAAVEAARRSFDEGTWALRAPEHRVGVIREFARLYGERVDEMARVISCENGSPLTFSQYGQVGGVLALVDGFLDAAATFPWADEVSGPYGTNRVWREPVGVVAAITAWNVPQMLIVGKLVPALLAGCSVVVKPALESPLDAMLLAEIIDQLELPPGVVSVLPGGKEVGQHLVEHPGVDKVSFTGSTAVGRQIGAACGANMKRMSLELGGKSAAIVLEDADLGRTADGLRFAAFMNNGQACAAQTRVLAPRARYDEVVEALRDAVSSFVVGDPLDPATEIGPLVNHRQHERVRGYIDTGKAEGARVVIGDDPLPTALRAGYYVMPTVFADVDNRMTIAQEEIFGPVVVVIPYDGEDDAVAIANDSMYGLGGSVWTADKAHGLDLASRVRTGMLGINRFGPDPSAPFGGYKASGIGREYGRTGIEAFTEIKTVHGA